MDILGELVLITSIYGSIVGVIILLTKKLFKNKINAKWGYVLWLILLFKLVIPFGPESDFSLFNNASISSIYQNNKDLVLENESNILLNNSNKTEENKNLVNNDNKSNETSIVPNLGESNLGSSELNNLNHTGIYNINFINYITYVWLLGTIVMLATFVISHYILYKKIKSESVNLNSEAYSFTYGKVNKILGSCKERFNINKNTNHIKKVSIVITNIINTPSIIGIINPKILIPSNMLSLSDKELEYVLLHELAHYKRKDILTNYLLIILQSIHWFNPILWYCFKKIREDIELATDELVLNILQDEEHNYYGKAILAVLEKIQFAKGSKGLVGIIDDKDGVEKRIKNIKNIKIIKNKKVSTTILGIAIVLILSTVLLTSGINMNKLDQSYLINFYMELVNKDLKGKRISSDELNGFLEKVEVDNFKKSNGIVSNIDDNGEQSNYSTDIYVYNIGKETLEVSFLIDEENDKVLDKVDSINWNLNYENSNDTKMNVYYHNGNFNYNAFIVGVYPENLSEQKYLFESIEKENEMYSEYFNIAKLIEEDNIINIDEIENLNNLNFKEIENQYELDDNIKIYSCENKGYIIYLNYKEIENKIVRVSIEHTDNNKVGLLYSKEGNSNIQIWSTVDNIKYQIQIVDKFLTALNYDKEKYKSANNNDSIGDSNIIEFADKLSTVRGYTIIPESIEEIMNGDSVVFDMMIEACVEGGYKRENMTNQERYVKTIAFDLVETSKDNNNIQLCLLVSEDNEVLGAFLDYLGEDNSFKSVDDTENMNIN